MQAINTPTSANPILPGVPAPQLDQSTRNKVSEFFQTKVFNNMKGAAKSFSSNVSAHPYITATIVAVVCIAIAARIVYNYVDNMTFTDLTSETTRSNIAKAPKAFHQAESTLQEIAVNVGQRYNAEAEDEAQNDAIYMFNKAENLYEVKTQLQKVLSEFKSTSFFNRTTKRKLLQEKIELTKLLTTLNVAAAEEPVLTPISQGSNSNSPTTAIGLTKTPKQNPNKPMDYNSAKAAGEFFHM
jgi:hypothetical protein